jgi:GntR family transcriptional regulator
LQQNAGKVEAGNLEIDLAEKGSNFGPWPKYHQIYLVLLQQIQEGEFPAGSALPNEKTIAEQFSVSRITVRKAMERLEREGRIERFRGRGTFARPLPTTSPVQASMSGSIENLIAMGLKTKVQVLSFDYVSASPEVAIALGLSVGSTVQKVVRLRSLEGRTFSHLVSYVPEDIGRTYTRDDLTELPLLVLLERGGTQVGKAEQVISATLATPDIAGYLGTDAGSPLLSVRRVVFDREDRPIEFIIGLYRPDTYENRMTFERRSESSGMLWAPASTKPL